MIEEGKMHEMGFEYIPNKHDVVESFWTFTIPEVGVQVPFLLVGTVGKPDLFLDTQTINFGRVLVGEKCQLIVKLNNNEDLSFPFKFDKQHYQRKRDTGVYMKDLQGWLHDEIIIIPDLIFDPFQGVVQPNESKEIVITYAPTCEGKQNFNITCNIKRFFEINMNVKGEGYSVHDKILLEIIEDYVPLQLSAIEPNLINFGEVLINDRVFKKFILTNIGIFSFEFLWLVGKTNEVAVVPLAGIIGPKEKLVCEMAYTPATIGPIVNFPVTCKVSYI
jgi:hydrocephalus-inducing protein